MNRRTRAALTIAAIATAATAATATTANAATPGVSTARTYTVGADTVTVAWYENGVFTLAEKISIVGSQAVTIDRYASRYCTAIMRGPGGSPPITWTPPSGIRTQCAPYVNVNGAHLTPPSQDPVSTSPPPDPIPTIPFP